MSLSFNAGASTSPARQQPVVGRLSGAAARHCSRRTWRRGAADVVVGARAADVRQRGAAPPRHLRLRPHPIVARTVALGSGTRRRRVAAGAGDGASGRGEVQVRRRRRAPDDAAVSASMLSRGRRAGHPVDRSALCRRRAADRRRRQNAVADRRGAARLSRVSHRRTDPERRPENRTASELRDCDHHRLAMHGSCCVYVRRSNVTDSSKDAAQSTLV